MSGFYFYKNTIKTSFKLINWLNINDILWDKDLFLKSKATLETNLTDERTRKKQI